MQYKNPPNNEPHKRPSEATKPQKNSGCRHLVRTRMKRIFSIAIWALAPLNNRLKVDAIVTSAPWHPDMTSQGNANIVPAFVQVGRCVCFVLVSAFAVFCLFCLLFCSSHVRKKWL